MYYLQQELGAISFGVDTNKIAVEYAKQGGLNFTVGNASKMAFFQDNSFDMVVSHFFLDPAYLSMFFGSSFDSETMPFMENVVKEIYRILKPGGFFFSQNEEIESLYSTRELFSSIRRLKIPGFASIDILQK
jgi:SAM-dependent methyltransferase